MNKLNAFSSAIILITSVSTYSQSVYDNAKLSNSTYVSQYVPGETQVKLDYYQTFITSAFKSYENKSYYAALIDFNKAIDGYGSYFAQPGDLFFRGITKMKLGYKCKYYCKDMKKSVKSGLSDSNALQFYRDQCPCKRKT